MSSTKKRAELLAMAWAAAESAPAVSMQSRLHSAQWERVGIIFRFDSKMWLKMCCMATRELLCHFSSHYAGRMVTTSMPLSPTRGSKCCVYIRPCVFDNKEINRNKGRPSVTEFGGGELW